MCVFLLIRFILNHESLTEEFCYMNRSGPYEPRPEFVIRA